MCHRCRAGNNWTDRGSNSRHAKCKESSKQREVIMASVDLSICNGFLGKSTSFYLSQVNMRGTLVWVATTTVNLRERKRIARLEASPKGERPREVERSSQDKRTALDGLREWCKKNKLAKARKTRTSPSTLGLKKFGLGKLWVKKSFFGSKKFFF